MECKKKCSYPKKRTYQINFVKAVWYARSYVCKMLLYSKNHKILRCDELCYIHIYVVECIALPCPMHIAYHIESNKSSTQITTHCGAYVCILCWNICGRWFYCRIALGFFCTYLVLYTYIREHREKNTKLSATYTYTSAIELIFARMLHRAEQPHTSGQVLHRIINLLSEFHTVHFMSWNLKQFLVLFWEHIYKYVFFFNKVSLREIDLLTHNSFTAFNDTFCLQKYVCL